MNLCNKLSKTPFSLIDYSILITQYSRVIIILFFKTMQYIGNPNRWRISCFDQCQRLNRPVSLVFISMIKPH